MSIVTHSVSKYNFLLAPGEWRIVFLFRNVWQHNVEYLKQFGESLDQAENDKNVPRNKRNNNKKRENRGFNVNSNKQKKRKIEENLFDFCEEETEEEEEDIDLYI